MTDAKEADAVFQGQCGECSDEALVRELNGVCVCRDCFETMKDQIEEWEQMLEDGEHAIKIDGDRYWRITDNDQWEQDYAIGLSERTRTTSSEWLAHMQIGTAHLKDEAKLVSMEQHPMTETTPNPFR